MWTKYNISISVKLFRILSWAWESLLLHRILFYLEKDTGGSVLTTVDLAVILAKWGKTDPHFTVTLGSGNWSTWDFKASISESSLYVGWPIILICLNNTIIPAPSINWDCAGRTKMYDQSLLGPIIKMSNSFYNPGNAETAWSIHVYGSFW